MTAEEASLPSSQRRTDRPAPLSNVVAVLGPTNTGKTHYAVERMLAHESGMIGLPLRLLAREVYDRVCRVRSPSAVALVTGEEKIIPENPSYWVCTVEAMPLERRVAFLAVDEIQLAADPERGHTFTSRLLHARGTLETLFLGAATMRGVIRELMPGIQFHQRSRLSQLSFAGERKVSRLPRRSAIVAFSADQVYGVAELIRRQRGGAAVVMGALSPRTRNAQVALYQSGDTDFIVATDAIGMGLNMDIDHVAFAARRKFDGNGYRDLRAHELAQIAGRAGRYMNDGTFGVTGECPNFDPEMVDNIENHRFDSVRFLQWRNDDIDFTSIDNMVASLEVTPTTRGLLRAKPAVDLTALKHMALNPQVTSRAGSEKRARLLWSVCQIPDFQQTYIDDHVRLLTNVFVHLTDNDGHLPEDWIAGHVEALGSTEGDIDTLSARLAFVRTWTFISNRDEWLLDPQHWQDRTRDIEDRLSDALHEKLTQRFIDRRTNMLIRRLNDEDFNDVIVDEDGEVAIEGEFIGRLAGFRFVLDPRAAESKSGLEARALRGAAAKALEPYIYRAAARLRAARKDEISLKDQGVLVLEGHPIARLRPGRTALKPRVELIASDMVFDLLGAEGRGGLVTLLEAWVEIHIQESLPTLVALQRAVEEEGPEIGDGPIPLGAEQRTALNGLARGIGFQLVEHFGALARADVAEQIKALTPEDRAQLRSLGVRFGEYSIYLPNLLKPTPARLMVLLWGVHSGLALTPEGVPSPPTPGSTSAPLDPTWTDAFLGAAGYRRCGARAVRIDILERLGNLIRKQRFPEPAKPVKAGPLVEIKGAPHAVAKMTSSDTGEAPASDAIPVGISASEPAAVAEDAVTPDAAVSIAAEPAAGSESAAPGAPDQPQAIPFKPRPGSFEVTGEMTSLAGCSATDFEDLLAALGYRKITIKQGSEEHIIWRVSRPQDERGEHQSRNRAKRQTIPDRGRDRGPKGEAGARVPAAERQGGGEERSDPPRRKDHGKERERQAAKPGRAGHPGSRPHHHKPRESEYDKDSPFAVLAQLKASLKPK